MRAAGAAHQHDLMAYKQTGQWQKQLLGDWSEKLREAHARTSMLVVRIWDASLREQVRRLKMLEVEVSMSQRPSDSERALLSMGELFDECNARIGELLRSLDDQLDLARESKTAVAAR